MPKANATPVHPVLEKQSMTEQTNSKLPPLTYGVWIEGEGWLKDTNEASGNRRYFATPFREVAESAVKLLEVPARVEHFDESMPVLEGQFLQRQAGAEKQRKRDERRAQRRRKSGARVKAALSGILGRTRKN